MSPDHGQDGNGGQHGQAAGGDQPGVRLEGRLIPFPRSISEAARTQLARLIGPDGAVLPRPELPDASDLAGWAATKQALNEGMLAFMKGDRLLNAGIPVVTEVIDGVTVHIATPAGAPQDRVYLDIHGGALIYGEGEFCRLGAIGTALQHGVQCYAVDYRTPPEHPFPAALDDCLAVYRHLLTRFDPADIIVGGTSAGGNLAGALMLRARDEGLRLPAACVLNTPELDLTESGDTFETNRYLDVVLPMPLMEINLIYAAGHPLDHPYLSPLFGDFAPGFPPTLLISGTRDLFLSNTVRMHRALLRAGVPVELHIFEAMPHGGFMGAPEDQETAAEIQRFVASHWGGSASRPQTERVTA